MFKYIVTILFSVILGLAGGYSLAVNKIREETKASSNEIEGTLAMGVLTNDSRLLILLTNHLNEQDRLSDDPQVVNFLKIGLQNILELDDVNREFARQRKSAPTMLESIRIEAEDALEILDSLPEPKE